MTNSNQYAVDTQQRPRKSWREVLDLRRTELYLQAGWRTRSRRRSRTSRPVALCPATTPSPSRSTRKCSGCPSVANLENEFVGDHDPRRACRARKQTPSPLRLVSVTQGATDTKCDAPTGVLASNVALGADATRLV